MAPTQAILSWTLVSECAIPEDVNDLLVEGETAIAAYKTFRDSAIFTNKRLIVRDAQGITGKKVEIYSLPYSSINMWSTENAGKVLDFKTIHGDGSFVLDYPRGRFFCLINNRI